MADLAETLVPFLVAELRQAVLAQSAQLEEIRLRPGQAVALRLHTGQQYWLGGEKVGEPTPQQPAQIATREMLTRSIQLISRSSFYALEEELRRGYVTLAGGHRVGLAGQAVLEAGQIRNLKNISSMNFRVARSLPDCAQMLRPYIVAQHGVRQTLLVAPPGVGKTTLLRDICRALSNGLWGLPPQNVGVVDERSEIAGCFNGLPQLDVGANTDVLDACPKSEGMLMLLRSMAPQIIVTDEIGSAADAAALAEVLNAGVSVLATAHGTSYRELCRRPALGAMLSEGYFERVIFLERRQGQPEIVGVYDECGRLLPLNGGGGGLA